MRSAALRLQSIVVASDPSMTCLGLGMMSAAWGLWLILPVGSLYGGRSFVWMVALLPEPAYAWSMFALGVALIVATVDGRILVQRACTTILAGCWLFLATFTAGATDWQAIGWTQYLMYAIGAIWCAWRLDNMRVAHG